MANRHNWRSADTMTKTKDREVKFLDLPDNRELLEVPARGIVLSLIW